MADRGGEFSFFRGLHVRIDKIDMFVSMRTMTTNFGKQVNLEQLTQMRLINQVLTLSRQDHVTLKKRYNFLLRRVMVTRSGK